MIHEELKELFAQTGDTFEIELIAGSDRLNPRFLQTWPKTPVKLGCYPKQCCNGLDFIRKYPCIVSKDIAADYYIYTIALDKSYTTTLPLLKGAPESYNSTIEASHNDGGSKGLDKIEQVVRDIYKGYIARPPYLKLRSDLMEFYKTWKPPPRPTKKPSVPTTPAKPTKKKGGPTKVNPIPDHELIL